MHTRELLERLAQISTELNMLYAEVSAELPDLRIVVDNAHGNSELKKMPLRKLLISRGIFIKRPRTAATVTTAIL